MFRLTLVHKIVIGLVLVAAVIGACLVGASFIRERIAANSTEYSFDYSWVDNNTYIAHALGGGSGQHLH